MRQAEFTVSVPLDAPPTGFLQEISLARPIDMIGSVRLRIEEIAAQVWMMRNMEDLPVTFAMALAGVETSLEDVRCLLSVYTARGVV